MPQTAYITTAIPYINALPHLGHVLEWFQADTLSRYQKHLCKDVKFVSGADENSLKNVQAAQKVGIEPQQWLDQYAKIFQDAYAFFGVELSGFRRGSDQEKHWPGVQEIWRRCEASGDIYKKSYTGLYCLGCEAFYSPEDLLDGKCPEHLSVPELIQEENYFFRLSKYQQQIFELLDQNVVKIVSAQYRNEMLGFVSQGLEDFSISRSIQRAKGFGVPVPNDPTQIMYVWFDALVIYLTAIGWGYDQAEFQKYWNAQAQITHVIGKGINRFHSVYWIGMLLSAGLLLPKKISVHGYITANGQKMSKSLGNVIDPFEVVKKYGVEPVRYYLLKYIPTHADGDFTIEKFEEVYTADLSNGLGNLCSRVAKMCEKSNKMFEIKTPELDKEFVEMLEEVELDRAIQFVMSKVSDLDKSLSLTQPWKKSQQEQAEILQEAVNEILSIAYHLKVFLPQTSQKIQEHFSTQKITALQPLFPRLHV